MRRIDHVSEDVYSEIKKQDKKWGADRNLDYFQWNTILTEEVGEFSQAALHTKFGGKEAGRMYEEIIQVAAVAMQIANNILMGNEECCE